MTVKGKTVEMNAKDSPVKDNGGPTTNTYTGESSSPIESLSTLGSLPSGELCVESPTSRGSMARGKVVDVDMRARTDLGVVSAAVLSAPALSV